MKKSTIAILFVMIMSLAVTSCASACYDDVCHDTVIFEM